MKEKQKAAPPSLPRPSTWQRDAFALAIVIGLGLLVYGRCATFESTLYDDPQIIFENPHVMSGLTFDSVYWAFTEPNLGLYMPLPTVSFMLDRNLFGDWAGGYHFMTLLWHLLCTCTFYLVMQRLFHHFPAVFAATLLVAVHPVQAMTVNWVSARNEIMPAFFVLLSIEAYRRYALGASRRAYCLSLGFMLLGLFSKQGPVMLPAALFLLDYWPLKRMELSLRAPWTSVRSIARRIPEKLPFFLLSGVGVFFAFYGKTDFGVLDRNTLTSPIDNLGFAMVSFVRYLGHLVYPVRYIMAFSFTTDYLAAWMSLAAATLLIAVTLAVLTQYRTRPYLMVGWGWFCLFLLPVSGLVRYATESIALRYLYAPGMGLYLLTGFALYEGALRIARRRDVDLQTTVPAPPVGFWAVVAVLTAVLAALCFWQSGFWRDSESLAWRALAVTNNQNAMAHNHLGVIRERQGRPEQAFMHFRDSTQLEPTSRTYRYNFANVLIRREQYQEALELLEPIMPNNQRYVPVLNLYGAALVGLNRAEEGIPYFERCLEIEPRYVPALYNMGFSLLVLERKSEARPYFERALAVQPTHRSAKLALEHLVE